MIRDLPRLANGDFDVLVVGGGIYGLAAAYDAAQRGLSVALVERSDFGSATSFNHLKTIHGGLRYLQSADVTRMRESIRERRTFARIAPRFVAPLPFVMPASTSLTRHPLAMRAAFALDALISSHRNDGLDAAHHLPAGRIVSGSEARELLAGVVASTLSTAGMWYDYQTVQGDRLTLAFALGAANLGAALANYTEAISPLQDNTKRFLGVRARDILTGDQFEIRARIVLNAGGPWGTTVLHRTGVPGRWPLLKAMNLVTSRPARKAAVVAATRTGRALVLLPWQGRTLVGTSESSDERQPDDQQASRAEMLAFLAEVNETFPGFDLQAEEVTLVHRGIVPAAGAGGRLSLLAHSRIVDHAAYGVQGVVSLVGVKYTTARVVAERTVDLLFSKLARPAARCRTAEVTLPGGALSDRDPTDPALHAVREEMAQTLVDVVVRRTGIGAAQHPGERIARQCADVMQTEMSWSEDRKQRELDSLERFYELV